MPRLSIVIPCLGDAALLERTLVSVLENRPDDCEVVVAANFEYDDPYDLVDEVRFVESPLGGRLGETLNAALRRCHAPIVHVLCAGAEASPDWVEPALSLFDDVQVAAVAPAVLDIRDRRTVRSTGLAYRPSGRHVRRTRRPDRGLIGPALPAAFYRRDALVALDGPCDAALPDELVDVDLNLRLLAAGGICRTAVDSHTFAAAVGYDDGASAGAMGRHVERLFWTTARKADAARSVWRHAALVVGETLAGFVLPSNFARTGGRILGAFDALFGRRPAATAPDSPRPMNVVLRNGDRVRYDGPSTAKPSGRSAAGRQSAGRRESQAA